MYISGGNGHATLSLPRRVIIYVDTRGVASCPDLVYLLIMDTLCLGCISVVGLRVNPIRSGPIRSVLGSSGVAGYRQQQRSPSEVRAYRVCRTVFLAGGGVDENMYGR